MTQENTSSSQEAAENIIDFTGQALKLGGSRVF